MDYPHGYPRPRSPLNRHCLCHLVPGQQPYRAAAAVPSLTSRGLWVHGVMVSSSLTCSTARSPPSWQRCWVPQPCPASPPLLNSTPPHRPFPNNPHWPGQSQPETGKESPAKEEVWYCCLHLQGHLGITVHVSDTKHHPATVRRCLNFLYQAKTQQQFSPYP